MKEVQRIAVFLSVCVTIRLLFAYVAFKQDKLSKYQHLVFGIMTGLIALGFFYHHFMNYTKGYAGSVKYWNSFLHGFLYSLFTILWFLNIKQSYVVLLVDVIIGLCYFLNHYAL